MSSHAKLVAVAGLAIAATSATAQDRLWDAPVNGSWTDAFRWNPADVPDSAGENAILGLGGGYTVTLPSGGTAIGSLSITNPLANLSLNTNVTLGLNGLLNNGFVVVNQTSSTSNSIVVANSDFTATGFGILRLAGGGDDAQLNTAPGVTLTNGPGHLIDGGGQINAALVNNGTIRSLTTGFANVLEIQGEDKVNNATIENGTGGILQIESVTIDQTGGGLIDANIAEVRLQGTNTLVGGSLESDTGFFQRQAGLTTLNNVVNNADLRISPSATITSVGSMFVNNNLVSLNNTSSISNAILNFDANALVTGPGIIRLNGGGDDAQINTAASVAITNDADHTIEGNGQINAALINNGLIAATNTGLGNILEIQGEDKVNNATLEAGTSAVVQIETLTITQSSMGIIDAKDDLVRLQATNTINGGTIASDTGIVERQSGTTTLNNVILDADFRVAPSATVHSVGTMFVNNQTFSLNNSSSTANAILNFEASALITGPGTILLNGGADDALITTADGVAATNDAGHTIEGNGQIDAALINNGTVTATNTGLGNVLELEERNKVNNATIAASTSAVLQIEGIAIDQTGGGTLDAADGTINFLSGTTSAILGGTITGGMDALVTRQSGLTTLSNVTLETDIDVAPSATIELTGSVFTNNAEIILNFTGSTANGVVQIISPLMIDGTGGFLFGGGINDSFFNSNPGVPITLGADQTIRGAGTIDALLTNRGTVTAENTGFGSVLGLSGQNITNEGTMGASANAILRLLAIDVVQQAGGSIDAADGTVQFQSGLASSITGGSLESTMGGIYDRASGATTLSGVTLNATLDVDPSGTINLDGNGLTNNGEIVLNNTGSTANATLAFLSGTELSGTGTVDLAGNINDAFITAAENETGVIGAGQTVTGGGNFDGDFTFGGTLALDGGFNGGGIGALILAPDTSLDFSDTTDWNVDVNSGTSFDQIRPNVSNTSIHLDGDLVVTADQAGAYFLGQEIDIIEQGATITGAFDTNNVANQFIGLELGLRLVQRSDELVLRVVNLGCPADLVQPLDVLDLSDVDVFIQLFLAQDPVADIAAPLGVIDLSDVDLYIQLFLNNCF
ncbi:MAG: GC-type dockerin domain-anchored protein [Planctomycetota bacterium]